MFNFYIFPNTEKLISSNLAKARLSRIMQSDNNIFVVENTYTVNFGMKSCPCKFSFEFGVPFIHFCAVLLCLWIDHSNYVNLLQNK
jgi:hypothetical protein